MSEQLTMLRSAIRQVFNKPGSVYDDLPSMGSSLTLVSRLQRNGQYLYKHYCCCYSTIVSTNNIIPLYNNRTNNNNKSNTDHISSQLRFTLQQQAKQNNEMIRSQSDRTIRWIGSATKPILMPLEEFRDTVDMETRSSIKVGRSWSVRELRIKSFEDLHKLWIVLYKERNMLLTEKQLCNRRRLNFPQPERITKVRKSMGAIKQVLGERKRDHLATLALRQIREEEGTAVNDDDDKDSAEDENHDNDKTKEK